MTRSVTFLLFLTVSLGSIWADDDIKAELDKARTTYRKQIEAAKQKFLAAAESKLQEYAGKGDFENAQEIESEKANFERDGSLPSSAKLSSAKREYKPEVRAAEAAFRKALQTARSAYTKALLLEEAGVVSAELKDFTAEPEVPENETQTSEDLLQEGSVWKGSRKFPQGGPPVPLELRVTSRDRQQFTGRIVTYYGNEWDIAGTVQGDKVEWTVVNVQAGREPGEAHAGVLSGNELNVEFVARRAAANGNRTGTCNLVISTHGKTNTHGNASTPAPADNTPSQKMPDVADFETFLARYDRTWIKAQGRLVQAMENQKKAIRSSDLDGDEKRQHIDAIDRDLNAFTKDGTLPRSDDVLAAVVPFLASYQKVIENLEAMRRHWSDRAVRLNDRAAIVKLDALEQRLNKIIGGREMFTTGSTWSGTFAKHGLGPRGRKIENLSFEMILKVTNCTGMVFDGELRQAAARAQHSRMAVEGKLDRNRITFGTTHMILGKHRAFTFDGYLLSDRIITNVEGTDVNGHPAIGWMSLWRDGAGPGQRSRRGSVSIQ